MTSMRLLCNSCVNWWVSFGGDPFAQQFHPVKEPYWQVFGHKQGFRPNLSIVDLLFNMAPEGLLLL